MQTCAFILGDIIHQSTEVIGQMNGKLVFLGRGQGAGRGILACASVGKVIKLQHVKRIMGHILSECIVVTKGRR